MNRKFLTFFSNPAFDVEQYVERLAWRSRAASESSFDPQVLFDEFSAHIQGENDFLKYDKHPAIFCNKKFRSFFYEITNFD